MVGAAVIGGAVIGGAASMAGASKQANAAGQASDASLQGTRESNQLQWDMYQQNLQNQRPYMQTGNLALAALTAGMGLGGGNGVGSIGQGFGGSTPQGVNLAQQATQLGGEHQAGGSYNYFGSDNTGTSTPMSTGGDTSYGINGNGSISARLGVMAPPGGGSSSSTPGSGGNTSGVIPGTTNYGASADDMNAAGSQYQNAFTQTFKPSDLTMDPSYQWRLQQGEKALQASAAAKGSLMTGQGLADINNYAQNSASQEYGNAFNRFQVNQTNSWNRLASLAGVGQQSADTVGAAGTQTGSNIAGTTMSGVAASNNYLTGGAAASAAGMQGAANAAGGAANTWAAYKAYSANPSTPVKVA
jgi:hypothetical protein